MPLELRDGDRLLDNEREDTLPGEAAALPQEGIPVNVRTLVGAVHRAAARHWWSAWPPGLFRAIMKDQTSPVPCNDCDAAINVHQLRADRPKRPAGVEVAARPELRLLGATF